MSGPGALSQRTDGKVPKMLPAGGDYGDRKALAQQQSAAPLSPQGGQQGGGGAPPGAAPARVGGQFGPQRAFSPSQRPGEPLTAGVDWGAGPGMQMPLGEEDPLLLLRVLHEKAPSAATARLLARLTRA